MRKQVKNDGHLAADNALVNEMLASFESLDIGGTRHAEMKAAKAKAATRTAREKHQAVVRIAVALERIAAALER